MAIGFGGAAWARPHRAHPIRASRHSLAASIVPAQPFQLPGGLDNAPRDVDCLADAVYYEARGESAAGQAAVAQVVLNRVRHPAFPKSICAVVFQGVHSGAGCQFSFACNGAMTRPREPDAWARAQDVATHALAGGVMAAVGYATNFHAARAGLGFGTGMVRVARIGMHIFYRLSGYAGDPDMFVLQPERSLDGAKPAQAEGRPSGQYRLASAPARPPAPAASAPAAPATIAAAPAAKAPAPVAKAAATSAAG
ncbi:MAG TPA: cell wall hydrolase [Caulobacteraceae bacterium]